MWSTDQSLWSRRLGVGVVGVDLEKECNDYEADLLEEESAMLLVEAGYPDTALYSFTPKMFADAWMFIAKKGYPNLCYELIEGQKINIGGYGLFETY